MKSECMGEWKPDPKLELAVRLWRDYYDACEVFDRRVCSGMRNGSALPINGDEFKLINRHAIERESYLRRQFREAEIGAETSQKAKDIALREHEHDLRNKSR